MPDIKSEMEQKIEEQCKIGVSILEEMLLEVNEKIETLKAKAIEKENNYKSDQEDLVNQISAKEQHIAKSKKIVARSGAIEFGKSIEDSEKEIISLKNKLAIADQEFSKFKENIEITIKYLTELNINLDKCKGILANEDVVDIKIDSLGSVISRCLALNTQNKDQNSKKIIDEHLQKLHTVKLELELHRYRIIILGGDLNLLIQMLPSIKDTINEAKNLPAENAYLAALKHFASMERIFPVLEASETPTLKVCNDLVAAQEACIELISYFKERLKIEKNASKKDNLNKHIIEIEVLRGALNDSLAIFAENTALADEIFPGDTFTKINAATAAVNKYAGTTTEANKKDLTAITTEFEILRLAVETGKLKNDKGQEYQTTVQELAERLNNLYAIITALKDKTPDLKAKLALTILLDSLETQYTEATHETSLWMEKLKHASLYNREGAQLDGEMVEAPKDLQERHSEFLREIAEIRRDIENHRYGAYTSQVDKQNPFKKSISIKTANPEKALPAMKALGVRAVTFVKRWNTSQAVAVKFLQTCIDIGLDINQKEGTFPDYKTVEIKRLVRIHALHDDKGNRLVKHVDIVQKANKEYDGVKLVETFLKALTPKNLKNLIPELIKKHAEIERKVASLAQNDPNYVQAEDELNNISEVLKQVQTYAGPDFIQGIKQKIMSVAPAAATIKGMNESAKTNGAATVEAMFKQMQPRDKKAFLTEVANPKNKYFHLAAALYLHGELNEAEQQKIMSAFDGTDEGQKIRLAICKQILQSSQNDSVTQAAAFIRNAYVSVSQKDLLAAAVYLKLPENKQQVFLNEYLGPGLVGKDVLFYKAFELALAGDKTRKKVQKFLKSLSEHDVKDLIAKYGDLSADKQETLFVSIKPEMQAEIACKVITTQQEDHVKFDEFIDFYKLVLQSNQRLFIEQFIAGLKNYQPNLVQDFFKQLLQEGKYDIARNFLLELVKENEQNAKDLMQKLCQQNDTKAAAENFVKYINEVKPNAIQTGPRPQWINSEKTKIENELLQKLIPAEPNDNAAAPV